jgi:predicted dienelactone hydrolase
MTRIAIASLIIAACGDPGANPADGSVEADAPIVIDGAPGSDAAATGDPALDGTATTTSTTVSIPGALNGRMLSSTVFTPSTPGPRPLVVISPGFLMARTQYTSYAQHLATWGFVTILTDYAESGFGTDHQRVANDIPAVITWALAQSNLAIDPAKIAVAGHSLGGKVSILAASQDTRIRAVVAWDPVDSNAPSVTPERMGTMTAAVAVIGETTNATGGFMPCAPAADNFTQYYAAAPSPALQATVAGADHEDWLDNPNDPSCFVCGVCGPGSAPADRARTATRRLDVAWLRKHLFADASMDAWLASTTDVAILTR